EHDVSLSRNDFLLGDNHTFNKEIFAKVMESYDGQETTSFVSASKARYGRLLAAKKAHEEAGKEFYYGESALFLGLLGDPKEGKIPVEYLRVLFEEERVPFKEGWRRSEKPIT
ncbi:Chloroperoxidase, partial [Hyaloscypha finlandica]